jgi:hypothetical protein
MTVFLPHAFFPGQARAVSAGIHGDIVGTDVCPDDVKRTTFAGLCCIFLAACNFVYFNLAFADQGAAPVSNIQCSKRN